MKVNSQFHLPTLVALAPHAWNDRWLSRQHLLSRLARRGWSVVYSHGPWCWWDREQPWWRTVGWRDRFAREDGVLVDHPGRWACRWPRWPGWDSAVRGYHAWRIGSLAANPEGVVLVVFHPSFWPEVRRLNPRWVVYHVYDVYSLMEDWNPAMAAAEAALVERADLITVASPGMGARLPGSGPSRARWLPNGADVAGVVQAAGGRCPEDLAVIPSPRIGYAGTINAKLDLAMLVQVARAKPAWHWVLIGPVRLAGGARSRDREAVEAWQQCQQLSNIHYLGVKPRDQVPGYLYHCEVLTICYRVEPDDWVVHGYPVKLHECLATGRPVVAAKQEVVRDHFAEVVDIAETPREWEVAIARALVGGVGDPDQRLQVAQANDWEQRVEVLNAWLLEIVGR